MPAQELSSLNQMTEAQLQSAVMDLAKLSGYELCYHVYDSRRSQPGFPDLVLASVSRKRLLFRELKTTGGRLSPAQADCIVILEEAGADVGIWRPVDLQSGRIAKELRGQA